MRAEEFTFDSTDADPHTAGHQIRMSAGRTTLVLVKITSANGMIQRQYIVTVRQAAARVEP